MMIYSVTKMDEVERLTGSVKIPKRFKGLSIDKIIQKAKKMKAKKFKTFDAKLIKEFDKKDGTIV